MIHFHERVGARLTLAKGHVAQQQPSLLEVYFGYPRHVVGAEQCACAEALGVLAARAELNAELQRSGAAAVPQAITGEPETNPSPPSPR